LFSPAHSFSLPLIVAVHTFLFPAAPEGAWLFLLHHFSLFVSREHSLSTLCLPFIVSSVLWGKPSVLRFGLFQGLFSLFSSDLRWLVALAPSLSVFPARAHPDFVTFSLPPALMPDRFPCLKNFLSFCVPPAPYRASPLQVFVVGSPFFNFQHAPFPTAETFSQLKVWCPPPIRATPCPVAQGRRCFFPSLLWPSVSLCKPFFITTPPTSYCPPFFDPRSSFLPPPS